MGDVSLQAEILRGLAKKEKRRALRSIRQPGYSGNLKVLCHGTSKLASWELLFLPEKAAKHASSGYLLLEGT
jgi:hypothetical protein